MQHVVEYHVELIPRSLMAALVAAHPYAARVPRAKTPNLLHGRLAARRLKRRAKTGAAGPSGGENISRRVCP
jgi:hypothetical protein